MFRELDIKGKTIIVTGGAKGIGEACCRLFAEKGANIVIADIDYENAVKVAKSIEKKTGSEVLTLKTDVTVEAEVKNLIKAAKEKFGSIDILINDAAIQIVDKFEKVSLEDWRRVLDVNLTGNFLCCREVIKEFKDGGQIINMTTVHSKLPRVNKYSYDASKAGMEMLTKSLARTYAKKNITVNAISFGAVSSPMNYDWLDDEDAVNNTLSKVPMEIIFKPEEVARFTYEILKNFSLYTTGSIFTIDGGRSLLG